MNEPRPGDPDFDEDPFGGGSYEKPAPKPEPVDPIYDGCVNALLTFEGIDAITASPTHRTRMVFPLGNIMEQTPDVTGDEIRRRGSIYRMLYSNPGTHTAKGLATHWARCEKEPRPIHRGIQNI